MKVTIKDIAQLAGVSRGTVDRALNNRGQIAPEIKKKILRIAKEQGYVKNLLASTLAKKAKKKISIVLPNPQDDVFWALPFQGIKKLESYVNNYGLIFDFHYFNLSDSSTYTTALSNSINSKPNAILTAPVFLQESKTYFQIAQQNNIPFVCINSEITHDDILCYIGQNSTECGQLAGKLFHLSKGDKKEILVLTLGHNTKNAIHINNKINGLKEYNRKYKCGYEILDFCLENYQIKEDLEQMAVEILARQDNLHGIFFTNSRAYRFTDTSLFSSLPKDVVKVGFDLIDENIALLREDQLNFILNQNPKRQGYLGIVNLFNHFIYNREIKPKNYLPIDIVVKENYKHYLDQDDSDLSFVM